MITSRNYKVRPTEVCNIFAMLLEFPIYVYINMSDTKLEIGNSVLP